MDFFQTMIGRSPNFESMMRSARVVAASDVTVLITGETGTGKELLAQALQKHSSRPDKPFVTINCAALPESLAESELFGHCKGAFTGAIANHKGLIQSTAGGTLFLDEVDSLTLALQAKLLRFLESGECKPVGETRIENVDVRIIAASNTDLNKKIEAGQFRRDLYYRLNVVPLAIPPLRERRSDIEHLLNHFIERFAIDHSMKKPTVSKAALSTMMSYDWPGNIRELRNLCQRLSILLAGRTIERESLPLELTCAHKQDKKPASVSLPETGLDLETLEIDLIHQALERTNGNRSKSARLLGMTRDTLLYRIQKYGIAA